MRKALTSTSLNIFYQCLITVNELYELDAEAELTAARTLFDLQYDVKWYGLSCLTSS